MLVALLFASPRRFTFIDASWHHHLKRDILLDLLLKALLQFHRVELEDLRGLDQLGRQRLPEFHSLRGFEAHSCHKKRKSSLSGKKTPTSVANSDRIDRWPMRRRAERLYF